MFHHIPMCIWYLQSAPPEQAVSWTITRTKHHSARVHELVTVRNPIRVPEWPVFLASASAAKPHIGSHLRRTRALRWADVGRRSMPPAIAASDNQSGRERPQTRIRLAILSPIPGSLTSRLTVWNPQHFQGGRHTLNALNLAMRSAALVLARPARNHSPFVSHFQPEESPCQ